MNIRKSLEHLSSTRLRGIVQMYEGRASFMLSTAERGERDAAAAILCERREANRRPSWSGQGRHPDSIYRLALGSVALAILAFGPVAVSDAHAQDSIQPGCLDRGSVLDHLSSKYGEVPIGVGLTKDGNALEITTSPHGTWTVIMTTPTGCTQVMTIGTGWETAPVGRVS